MKELQSAHRPHASRNDLAPSEARANRPALAIGSAVFIAFLTCASALRAQWPAPSYSELFGSFECRLERPPSCVCSEAGGRHQLRFEQLMATAGDYPLPEGGEADRARVMARWRGQCGSAVAGPTVSKR